MHKRIIGLLLAILLVGMAAFATAEGVTIVAPIDYTGVWVKFPAEGFQLYIPEGWYVVQGDDFDGVVMTDQTTAYRMSIETQEGDGLTMDAVLDAFLSVPSFEGVGLMYFGNIPFVSYDMPGADMFGAVTLSADNSRAYFFKFTPYTDPAFSTLAVKILASLRPVE